MTMKRKVGGKRSEQTACSTASIHYEFKILYFVERTCFVAYSSARMLYEMTRNLVPGVDTGLAAGSTKSRLDHQQIKRS